MSQPGSTAPEDLDAFRRAADRARRREPHRSDDMLAAVLRAAAGDPALVHTPEGMPAYCLVPFTAGKLAAGFARVELDGKVSQLGAFGAGAEDRAAWPPASFFTAPPPHMLQEIQRRHPDADIAAPLLTYDRSPARWAWRVNLESGAVFISPGGWYVSSPTRHHDREG